MADMFDTDNKDNMALTGIGMSAAFADTADALYEALAAGGFAGGASPMPEPKKGHGLVFTDNITKKLYAAYLAAAADSGIDAPDKSREAIFIGNAQGSLESIVNFEARALEKGYKAVLPMDFVNTVMNAPAGQLAILSGARGMNLTLSDGSSASAAAMAYCADMLSKGRADIAVTGGIEEMSPLYETYIKSRGAEPSDGVCVFTAERESAARERGADIYAVWLGSAGAYYETPDAENVYGVMSRAVRDAGISETDVDVIVSCCGTAETAGVESAAAERFGCPHIDIGRATGELYGTGGAFSAAAAIAVLKKGALPDGTPLKRSRSAMVSNVGWDGYISCFILKRTS